MQDDDYCQWSHCRHFRGLKWLGWRLCSAHFKAVCEKQDEGWKNEEIMKAFMKGERDE